MTGRDKWQKTYRRAASLAASRTSGFSALFFWITSKEAPTIDLEYGFLVVRRLFLTASAWISYRHKWQKLMRNSCINSNERMEETKWRNSCIDTRRLRLSQHRTQSHNLENGHTYKYIYVDPHHLNKLAMRLNKSSITILSWMATDDFKHKNKHIGNLFGTHSLSLRKLEYTPKVTGQNGTE